VSIDETDEADEKSLESSALRLRLSSLLEEKPILALRVLR